MSYFTDKSKLKRQYIKDYTNWTTPTITLEDGCLAISTKQHLREDMFVDLTLSGDTPTNARIADELKDFLDKKCANERYEVIPINEIVK